MWKLSMMFSIRHWKQTISVAVLWIKRLGPNQLQKRNLHQGKQKPMAKILLAEDDATMISLLKTLLKMEGFEVVAVDVNADVPSMVRQEMPDAIFMDVHLGGK